jgi:putative dehydrogenase
MTKKTVTVIGLGSMGLGMAQSLVRAGHDVFGIDLNPDRIAELTKAGGRTASMEESAAASDIIISVVLNADQTRAVLFGEAGCAAILKSGALIISCATVPPAFAREMASTAEQHGLHYLDAPISGGAIKAAAGKLSIMASGNETAFALAKPVLDATAEVVHDLGRTPGSGSAMKSVNQLLAGVHIAAMGEALAFGVSQGLDMAQVIKVITTSAGNSWMFENRAPHVRDNDYSPRSMVNIWPKDLGIVREIADEAGLPVPMTETALIQFKAAADAGDGATDDAAVTKVYARAAGLKLPGEE